MLYQNCRISFKQIFVIPICGFLKAAIEANAWMKLKWEENVLILSVFFSPFVFQDDSSLSSEEEAEMSEPTWLAADLGAVSDLSPASRTERIRHSPQDIHSKDDDGRSCQKYRFNSAKWKDLIDRSWAQICVGVSGGFWVKMFRVDRSFPNFLSTLS